MYLKTQLAKKNMTIKDLSLKSNLSYATCYDLINEKSDISKCSINTIFKISRAMNMTIESLMEPYLIERHDFEWFKSEMCHTLKRLGDIDFLIEVIGSKVIQKYFEWEWYPECLYTLAMVDYVSRENGVSLCEDYAHIREYKLAKPIYPSGAIATYVATNDESIFQESIKKAIPEFLKYNIVEGDIRNVI